MGGPGAPDDLVQGHVTQVWLAVSGDPRAHLTGKYWHHQLAETPARATTDHSFQDALLDELKRLTGGPLP
jgi:hypothetical protein